MNEFLEFFASNWRGILVFLLLVAVAVVLLQWIAWIFSLGRFSGPSPARGETPLRHVFADLVVKIIDDFRHLLALIVILIFALALTYVLALVAYEQNDRIGAASSALQAVSSSMGGLIGAIIGYYFGEKAGERAAGRQSEWSDFGGIAVQKMPTALDVDSQVQQAPIPPLDQEIQDTEQ